MAVDLNREPDYSALTNTLLEKTRAGKLQWMPTAIDHAFLAAAKGVSYEVRRLGPEYDFMMGEIESTPEETWEREALRLGGAAEPMLLRVKDADGRLLIDFVDSDGQTHLSELWRTAHRLAMRLDERIGELVTELSSL